MSQDFAAHLAILSSPPGHGEYHVGATEGSRWESRCNKEVLPGILKHLQQTSNPTEDSIDALMALQKAYQHPEVGGHSDFEKYTWNIIDIAIEHAEQGALWILCAMVQNSANSSINWERAVKTLINHKYRDVAGVVLPAVLQRYSTRLFLNHINTEEFDAALQAMYVFEWDQRHEVTKTLLESTDEQLKRAVVESLGAYGDRGALRLLKKRLGGFLRKPEKDDYVRKRISNAVTRISRRQA